MDLFFAGIECIAEEAPALVVPVLKKIILFLDASDMIVDITQCH